MKKAAFGVQPILTSLMVNMLILHLAASAKTVRVSLALPALNAQKTTVLAALEVMATTILTIAALDVMLLIILQEDHQGV